MFVESRIEKIFIVQIFFNTRAREEMIVFQTDLGSNLASVTAYLDDLRQTISSLWKLSFFIYKTVGYVGIIPIALVVVRIERNNIYQILGIQWSINCHLYLSLLQLFRIFPEFYLSNNLCFRQKLDLDIFLRYYQNSSFSIVFSSSIQPSKIGTTRFMSLISGKTE